MELSQNFVKRLAKDYHTTDYASAMQNPEK